MTEKKLKTLESVWETGQGFLDNYEDDGPGSFFHPVSSADDLPSEAETGALLHVTLRFLDRDAEFNIHARVIERSSGERCGLLLELLPEERQRRELVLTCAEGESLPYYRRRHERMPCELAVRLLLPGDEERPATAVSISEGGLRLAPEHGLESEEVIRLVISFEGEPLRLRGRVTSVTTEGPEPGAGVEFQFSSASQRDALIAEVKKLRG